MKKVILSFILLFSFVTNAQFWTDKNVPFPSANYIVDKIDIVDANTTWVCGTIGTINYYSRSTNGGATWSGGTILLPGSTVSSLTSITAVSSQVAWISVYGSTPASNGIWRTTNGGTTWSRQTTALFNSVYSYPTMVHFFDFNNGFCHGDEISGYTEMYTTSNGGDTWIRVPDVNIPSHNGYGIYLDSNYEVVGNTIMFVDAGGYFYKSTNRGLNWSAIDTPVSDGISRCTFTDQNNGIIMSQTGLLYKTNDGGLTWSPITYTGTLFKTDIEYIQGSNKIVSVGSGAGNSGSSASFDGGLTWIAIDSSPKLASEFLNTEIGYSTGKTTSTTAGGVFKYTSSLFTSTVTTLNENFSGLILPNGWTTQSLGVNLCPWIFSNPFEEKTNARMFLCNATNEWLITPTLDLSSYNDITLSFLPRIFSEQAVTNNTHDIKVKVSTNGGTTWNQIWSDDTDIISSTYASVSPQLFYTTVKRSLAAYCGAGFNNVKIAFQITSIAGTTNSSFRLFNVKVSNDCPVIQPMINTAPNNIVTGIVDVYSDFDNYYIEYGLTGFVQGNGTTINNITTKKYSISSLLSCTDYQLYIKANCSVASSLWSVYPFTTRNSNTIALTVPFIEDFNGSLCQIGYDGANIGNNLSGINANNELKMISTTVSNPSFNSLVTSKQFNLTAGVPVQIKWKNKRVNTSFCSFDLRIRDLSQTTATTILSRNNGISETSFDENTQSFTPVTSGNHIIQFVIYNAGVGVGTIIDEFSVRNTLSTNQFGSKQVAIYPNPTNDIVTISSLDKINQIKIYNLLGQEVFSISNVRSSVQKIDLSKYTSGNYIISIELVNGNKINQKILKN